MKLKKVGFLVMLLFTAFVVTGYMLPAQVHVERSITIDRPVSMMFELLNGYQHYKAWSPWHERDPKAEFIISGPETGVGARLSWIGEPHLVGSGWQEIVASTPFQRIDITLDLEAQGVAATGFLLSPEGDSTRLSWFFDSDLTKGVNFLDSFLARYFGLLFDRWMGGDYERGLAALKVYAESLQVSDFSPLEIERLNITPQDILFVTTRSSQEPHDVADAMAAAYAEISSFMSRYNIEMSGQPMAITRSWEGGGYQYDAAIPVDTVPELLSGSIQFGQSPGGRAVRAVHHGAYDEMMPTYEKLAAYMSAHGLQQGEVSWEHYITDPGAVGLQERVTHIYIMLDEQRLLE